MKMIVESEGMGWEWDPKSNAFVDPTGSETRLDSDSTREQPTLSPPNLSPVGLSPASLSLASLSPSHFVAGQFVANIYINVHDITLNGFDRTNNFSETFHKRVQLLLGVDHPNIWLFITSLKKLVQQVIDVQFEKAIAGYNPLTKRPKYLDKYRS